MPRSSSSSSRRVRHETVTEFLDSLYNRALEADKAGDEESAHLYLDLTMVAMLEVAKSDAIWQVMSE